MLWANVRVLAALVFFRVAFNPFFLRVVKNSDTLILYPVIGRTFIFLGVIA